MSQTRFRLEGFTELRAALRRLPTDLVAEAVAIVDDHGTGAAEEIVRAYERPTTRPISNTGNLAAGVKVTRRTSAKALSTAVVVRSTAPHAFIFENGTEARHYVTKNNVRHETGRMPPFHVLIPIAIRWRARMNEALIALVERAGLVVTGHE